MTEAPAVDHRAISLDLERPDPIRWGITDDEHRPIRRNAHTAWLLEAVMDDAFVAGRVRHPDLVGWRHSEINLAVRRDREVMGLYPFCDHRFGAVTREGDDPAAGVLAAI